MRKTPTLKDLAGRLGMHKSTVSLALSGKGTISAETRQQVLSAALEVPIYTCYDPGNSEGKPGDGVSQAAQVRQLCRQRPQAVVCAAQRVHPAVFAELEAYQSRGGVVVSYDTPVPLACDRVIFDREDNAYRAAKHLLERGHRHIGIAMSEIAGGAWDPQGYRLNGFRRALEEFNVPFRDEWFFRTGAYESGGAAMAQRFLALKERPTAVTIVNDYVALAFMVEVMRAGVRIPEDLSVVGHDNQPIATYCPVPLTSMTQPTQRIAEAVVELLMARLEDRVNRPVGGTSEAPRKETIVGDLVLRESVAVLPG